MSQAGSAERQSQIIIVRRAQPEDDGHHGGVWKIAFADFMTALMAFFLVMWLTSVSDESTKRQIAQYFNPIKLNSSTPPTQGLSTGDTSAAAPTPDEAEGPSEDAGEPSGKPVGGTEEGGEDQALFRDPYAVLAEIAAESGPGVANAQADGVPDGSGLPGLNGGEAYRDPFDPASWQLQPNIVAGGEEARPAEPSEFETVATEVVPEPEPEAEAETESAAEAAGSLSAENEALRAEIQRLVAASDPDAAAGLEVTEGEGTVTISLGDSLDSGMFQIGSAKPTGDAVRLMEKIAAVLQERQGTITIRGHTDARPYSGGEYDNWRLSTARAHMAYYMLLRGGLEETRVTSIEGFADRQPKTPADPEAAANRRIEILLTEPRA